MHKIHEHFFLRKACLPSAEPLYRIFRTDTRTRYEDLLYTEEQGKARIRQICQQLGLPTPYFRVKNPANQRVASASPEAMEMMRKVREAKSERPK